MESWENKLISDKINSLQHLPDGYQPNLSSKWEIIEAGLPKNKKRIIPLSVRWPAAAMLAGVFLTVTLLNRNSKRQEGIMAAVNMHSLHIPSVIQTEQPAMVAKPVVIKNNKVQTVQKPVPALETAVMVKQEKLELIHNELQLTPVVPVTDSATGVANEPAITALQPEASKQAKRRTFQKDFNDNRLTIDTGYSKPAGPQFSFKLQLHKLPGDEAQPFLRLQLKQVL